MAGESFGESGVIGVTANAAPAAGDGPTLSTGNWGTAEHLLDTINKSLYPDRGKYIYNQDIFLDCGVGILVRGQKCGFRASDFKRKVPHQHDSL
jgi:hypothetical protein